MADYKNGMKYIGLSSQLLGTMAVLCWAGFVADKSLFGSMHIAIIVLPLLGLIVSLWILVREIGKPKK
jgi:F0F1-type ATP synthase assembly protein I